MCRSWSHLRPFCSPVVMLVHVFQLNYPIRSQASSMPCSWCPCASSSLSWFASVANMWALEVEGSLHICCNKQLFTLYLFLQYPCKRPAVILMPILKMFICNVNKSCLKRYLNVTQDCSFSGRGGILRLLCTQNYKFWNADIQIFKLQIRMGFMKRLLFPLIFLVCLDHWSPFLKYTIKSCSAGS